MASRAAAASVRATIADRLAKDLGADRWWWYAGMISGVILSAVGFHWWYERVQVFLDQSLRRDAVQGEQPREAATPAVPAVVPTPDTSQVVQPVQPPERSSG